MASIGNKSQIGRTDDIPYEIATAWRVYPSSTTAEEYYVTIRKRVHGRTTTTDPCADVDWVELTVHDINKLEHTTTGSIIFPATSRDPGLLAVGAAPHYNTSTIQSYSSQGPTSDERVKPEVVGADCGEAMLRPSEFVPGTSIARAGTNCWFWGTSQAAPHVAGLAALIIDWYDNPDAREYTAEDVANWIKETATQRIISTDPNNTWGHGFAMLPPSAPTASLTPAPVPSSMNWGTTKTFTITASDMGTTGVDVRLNRKGEAGSLTLTSTGNTACTWEDGATDTRSSTQYTFTVKGCASGKTNMRLYKANTDILLAVYPIEVISTATARPLAVGVNTVQTVEEGATVQIDMTNKFTGIVERYAVTSSNEAVTTASMSGPTLLITGVKAGSTSAAVTASNPRGSVTKTYNVTVTAATTTPTPGGPTIPTGGPSVNAGSDQTVSTGATVSLFGTGTPVNDDDDASYSWIQRDVTTVSLKNYTTPSLPYTSGLSGNAAKFTAPSTAGILIFRLTVTDAGTGISSWDELAIEVQ